MTLLFLHPILTRRKKTHHVVLFLLFMLTNSEVYAVNNLDTTSCETKASFTIQCKKRISIFPKVKNVTFLRDNEIIIK